MLFGVGLSKFPEYDISFIVFDHQQPKMEEYGRVKVYRHSYYKSYEAPACALGLAAALPCHEHIDTPRAREAWNTTSTAARRCREAVAAYVRKAHYWLGLFVKQIPFVPMELLKTLVLRSLGANAQTSTTASDDDSMATVTGELVQTDRSEIYKDIDADIYCVFGVSAFVGEVAHFCKIYGKRLILFIGSDIDIDINYHNNDQYVKNIIAQSDIVIAQTHHQSRIIRDTSGKESSVIKNPIALEDKVDIHEEIIKRDIALWIGKSDRIKQPEVLLRLAERYQNVHFLMVLNCSHPEIFERIMRHKTTNVEVIERESLHHIDTLFAKAMVIINTSSFEGFPNTFLQAGKYGVPILSFNVDPDGFIESRSCGICANGNFENFVNGFYHICFDKDKWDFFSENLKRYTKENHNMHEKILEFSHTIESLTYNKNT